MVKKRCEVNLLVPGTYHALLTAQLEHDCDLKITGCKIIFNNFKIIKC